MPNRPTVAIVLSILMLEGPARAQEEQAPPAPPESRKFGSARSVAISGDFSVALRRWDPPSFSPYTTVMLRPTLDYFLLDHISVGGGVGVGYSGSTFGHTTEVSIGPRVGYDIRLGDRFSVWPTVGTTYTRSWIRVGGQGGQNWMLSAVASADVIGEIAPHFFMGFGPYVTGALAQNQGVSSGVAYGLASTLGGWL